MIIKSKKSPNRKTISAILSNLSIERLLLRIDKYEKTQLAKNTIIAIEVRSSITDSSLNLFNLSEVNTTKHNPNKVAEVLRI